MKKEHALMNLNHRLRSRVVDNKLTPEDLLEITKVVSDVFSDWQEKIVEQIQHKISDWEATMGDEDKTYYSLGLRRALDIVTGIEIQEQLPVLETSEFLPKDNYETEQSEGRDTV